MTTTFYGDRFRIAEGARHFVPLEVRFSSERWEAKTGFSRGSGYITPQKAFRR